MATKSVLADDPIYKDLFSVEKEVERHGGALLDDIYPRFAALRAEHGSVVRGSLHDLVGNGLPKGLFTVDRPHYATLDFEATNRAVNDGDTYTINSMFEYFPGIQLGRTILHMSGAEHRRHRGTVQPMFSVLRARDWWKPKWIEELVDALLTDFEKDGRADLNQQLCARLPMHTITRGFGLDEAEALAFRHNLILSLQHSVPIEQREEGARIVRETLLRAIDARRADPRDDVLSALVAARFEDSDGSIFAMDEEDMLSFCRIIMTAGGGTTWRQLGITIHALLSDPELWDAVKSDRKLIDKAITEAARWNPTDPVFYRLTEKDSALGGVEIPAGSIVELCYGAANRDPARYPDPDAFRLDRPSGRHFAFGGGVHTCLGMFVAQQEMSVALNALADRMPALRLDPDVPPPVITGGLEHRGVNHMHVRFD